VGGLILAGPIRALRVEFTPEEGRILNIVDGRTLGEWTAAILDAPTKDGDYVRGLVEDTNPVSGPLVCMITAPNGNLSHPLGPVIIYDGGIAESRGSSTFGLGACTRSRPI
jgi:hypothetical protein